MQATPDKEKRRKLRQQIQDNLADIVVRIDDLEKSASDIRNHLHMHDRFFFRQAQNLQESEAYGTEEDLVGLYLDTVRMIGQLERARLQMNAACTMTHFYDYSTCAVFQEFAQAEAQNL